MKAFALHRHEKNQYDVIERVSISFDLEVEDVVEMFKYWSRFDCVEDLIDIDA